MTTTTLPAEHQALWHQALPGLRRQVLPLLDQEGVVPREILVVVYADGGVVVLGPDAAKKFLEPYRPLRNIVESLDPDRFPVIMLPDDGKAAITSSRVVSSRKKRTLN
jgi:hypothetical protein